MKHHTVLRVVGKVLVGPVMLFALYVQFHGDYGPGGGFQAGVVFAAGFFLYGLIFGEERLFHVLPPWLVRNLVAIGVLMYAGVGVVSLLMGANFLDYSVLGSTPRAGQHLGILLVELGVGTTVFGVMMAVFYAFSSRWPEP